MTPKDELLSTSAEDRRRLAARKRFLLWFSLTLFALAGGLFALGWYLATH